MLLSDLPHSQKRLLELFSGSNHDVVFVPHEPFDMWICGALADRGLVKPCKVDGDEGFELTPAGNALVNPTTPKA